MANEFMLRRHSDHAVPERIVRELVRRAAGGQAHIEAIERVVRGYDSEVYAVTCDGGRQLFAKFRRHGGASYAQQAWAIERARAAGAPAPEVLLLDTVENGDERLEALVERAVPGRPLIDVLPRLDAATRRRVFAQAGVALRQIHSVRVGGFYRRHADGSWDFPNWDAIMESHLRERTAEAPLIEQCGFSERDVAQMLAMLADGIRSYRCDDPVLSHGDFLPGHLFVDDDLRLTGVIDFGEFSGGAPIGDLLVLRMDYPEIDLAWLGEGYGDDAVIAEAAGPRGLLHVVGIQMGYLAHFVRQNNSDEIGPTAAGLRATLREWRSATSE